MSTGRFSLAVALPLVLLAGCGSSSSTSSSSGNKTAFCSDNAKIDMALSFVTSPAQILSTLKGQKATIDDFARNTPGAIKGRRERAREHCQDGI